MVNAAHMKAVPGRKTDVPGGARNCCGRSWIISTNSTAVWLCWTDWWNSIWQSMPRALGAIDAVPHSILTAIWHMLKHNTPYRELGAGYYGGFHREHRIKAYLKRLQVPGWVPEQPPVSA